MVEIKIMGSEWMCLLELIQKIVSILKKLELVFSLVKQAQLKILSSIHVVITL